MKSKLLSLRVHESESRLIQGLLNERDVDGECSNFKAIESKVVEFMVVESKFVEFMHHSRQASSFRENY